MSSKTRASILGEQRGHLVLWFDIPGYPRNKRGERHVLAECIGFWGKWCGRWVTVQLKSVRSGLTRSCGYCARAEGQFRRAANRAKAAA
jgi:hypothetical protein